MPDQVGISSHHGVDVYLIHLDDGGKDSLRVFGGLVIDHEMYLHLETFSAMVAADLVPPERRASFSEFHASDLFVGQGAFEGIDEAKRHGALKELIRLAVMLGAKYFYSAVDTKALQRSPIRSASWVDIAFHLCACAIDDHVRLEYVDKLRLYAREAGEPVHPELLRESRPITLMVIDEPGSKKDKELIRNSFRSLRQTMLQALQPTGHGQAFTWNFRLGASLDQVLFGSSADSVGLQMADACNWATWRHLIGEDDGDFFGPLRSVAICAKPEPDWATYKHLLRCHDEPA